MTTTCREHAASSLGRILQILLAITGGVTLVVYVWLATRLRTGTFVMHLPQRQAFGRTTWTGTSLGVPLSWTTAAGLAAELVWLIWQYRATANLWARGYPALKIRPGWAVGWWLVPFASLVMPCVAMLELDRRSTPTGAARKASPLVGVWWALWLSTVFVPVTGLVVAIVPRIDAFARSIDEQATSIDFSTLAHAAAPWLIAAGVLRAIAAGLAIAVVRRIDAAQRVMMQASSVFAPAVPARPDGGIAR